MNKSSIPLLTLVLVMVLVFACKKESTEPANNPEVLKVSEIIYSECLNKGTDKDQMMECTEYSVLNEHYLKFVRTNVCFNCCYDNLIITVEQLDDFKIKITERESGMPCSCNCLYDIEYTIGPIDYGEYEITIDENYWEPMVFDVSFDSSTGSSYCEERTGYPWDL